MAPTIYPALKSTLPIRYISISPFYIQISLTRVPKGSNKQALIKINAHSILLLTVLLLALYRSFCVLLNTIYNQSAQKACTNIMRLTIIENQVSIWVGLDLRCRIVNVQSLLQIEHIARQVIRVENRVFNTKIIFWVRVLEEEGLVGLEGDDD